MQTGTYKTTDPNVRIRVVVDEEYPVDHPDYPFAPGVLEDLQRCYEEGDYYGVIVERRYVWTRMNEDGETVGITRFEWEEEDSILSCAGYENVAEEVAKGYFGITVTGRE